MKSKTLFDFKCFHDKFIFKIFTSYLNHLGMLTVKLKKERVFVYFRKANLINLPYENLLEITALWMIEKYFVEGPNFLLNVNIRCKQMPY